MAPLFLLLLVVSWASALCPLKCTCSLDNRGRNSVLCKEGGLQGPLTLANVSLDTEVLRITAPEDNTNMLTMSPTFHSYTKLEEIYITRSNIPQLGMHFFWGLSKLDILDLSQNNITQPLDHNFRGLSRLKELYLDDNRIVSLPSGTFRYLHELKLLSIQRNRLSRLMPRLFLEIGKLKVLKLSGNHLMDLTPNVFEDVQELRDLECRSCGLTKIDKRLYEVLPHLTHLDLGDNKLTYITSDEFKSLVHLRHLKMDGNHIASIKSPVFANQRELQRINLARNGLTKISPVVFDNLHNLTELDLSHNKLENPENGLLEPVAATLEVLAFSGNHIDMDTLEDLLVNLGIRELHLAECGFVDVTEGVIPESVQVLDLGGNHLSSLRREALPVGLVDLDISGNRFRGLDEELLLRLEGLQALRLERNPWSCDLCFIVPMLERANRSAALRDVKCAQPYTEKGKKLGMLHRQELSWCTVPSYTSASDANYFLLGDDGRIGLIAAGSSVCLLLIVVLALLIGLCYSRRHAAKYYTHEDKLAIEGDVIFDNNHHSPLFCEERELSFKFPLDTNGSEKKLSISTIDEIKREHAITNGT